MANITAVDQEYLEQILGMSTGYVLNFTNATFGQLFQRHGIDIHSSRYSTYGTSKAKKLRAFWDMESDSLVGKILSEMLGVYKATTESRSVKPALYKKCRKIVTGLCGKATDADSVTDGKLSDKEFEMPDVRKLPVDPEVREIISVRLEEAQRCLAAEAYLAAAIMCGSVLETTLLGMADRDPKRFGRSKFSPKKDGKVKQFSKWNLANFIDVARDVGLLKADAQGFSHELRDFRNYIHPAKQVASGFAPRRQTAKLCFGALAVALGDVAREN